MKISDIYGGGGNFLNAKAVKEKKLKGMTLTIKGIAIQPMKDGKPKAVLHFDEIEEQLVVNATNAKILGGDEIEEWTGKKISLSIIKTDFKGEMVDSVQIEVL